MAGPFPRSERLTNGAEFQALFQQGKRIDRSSLVVLWRPAERHRRAGFAVSRQLRGAVHRNRARRRMREAYRVARTAAPAAVDLVIIAKRRAVTDRFEALTEELTGALASIPGARSGA
ncbi:MAG: ribonuclease P protein component [Candidatus Rokubacteria bacterium]|nr:ribonuclease P protein component [Candidatus Rokubacteria bacterium]